MVTRLPLAVSRRTQEHSREQLPEEFRARLPEVEILFRISGNCTANRERAGELSCSLGNADT
jgi:hypothetical protein